jgi:transposase
MSSSVAQAEPTAVIAVDVGKAQAAVLVTDAQRHRLLGPVEFAMTGCGVSQVIEKVLAVISASGVTRVGVEAAGHYHRPLLTGWPHGWEVVELNPAHVAEQRRVMGRRRVKTDAIDLEAITELLLAGRGVPVTAPLAAVEELTAWAGHRQRRVATRTATKNQLLGQLDRCFPGLTLAVPDVLGTRVGRLVAEQFADPGRLASLGVTRFIRFAAARGLRVRRPVADRLVAAARDVLPSPQAVVARQVLAADLNLLTSLEEQVRAAEEQMATLLPVDPVRDVDHRAWLGCGPGRQLWCCGR